MQKRRTGWIKLHRQLLDSQVFNNPRLLQVWIWCLLRAAPSETDVILKKLKRPVHLLPGQFITSRRTAGQELGMAERTAWDYLHTLEALGNLTISPSTKYTVVSLVKWDFFQARDEKSARKVTHDVTRKVTHDVTRNREYIENLKEKERKEPLPSEEIDESEYW